MPIQNQLTTPKKVLPATSVLYLNDGTQYDISEFADHISECFGDIPRAVASLKSCLLKLSKTALLADIGDIDHRESFLVIDAIEFFLEKMKESTVIYQPHDDHHHNNRPPNTPTSTPPPSPLNGDHNGNGAFNRDRAA